MDLVHDLLIEQWADELPNWDEVRRHMVEARGAQASGVVSPQDLDAYAHVGQRGRPEAAHVEEQARPCHAPALLLLHATDVVLHHVGSVDRGLLLAGSLGEP